MRNKNNINNKRQSQRILDDDDEEEEYSYRLEFHYIIVEFLLFFDIDRKEFLKEK